jgi:anti-sigma factor RsiW
MTSFEDRISLMVPAYLRGDLSAAENREIEAAAANNPSVAADIEFQRNLKSSLGSDGDFFESGELGWARLSKAIKQEGVVSQPVTQKPQFWKYAAAVLAVAAIGQAGVLGSIASKDGDVAQYKTVSENANPNFATAKLGFAPDVTAKRLTETLLSLNGSIVAGPSSLGLYEVQFKSKSACTAALETLQSHQSMIETISACE